MTLYGLEDPTTGELKFVDRTRKPLDAALRGHLLAAHMRVGTPVAGRPSDAAPSAGPRPR